MPLPFAYEIVVNGPPDWLRKHAFTILYSAIAVATLVLLKLYTSGRTNLSDRNLHGKVVLITGGTSGIGSRVAHHLASRGAQLVLLTQTPVSDPFLVEYIQDLRDRYRNQLIYAEQVDLSSLHSIRKFATKWIDNAPPRRLDMIVLCAATMTAPNGKRKETAEGIEETWMVNFLANFHLLGILSPALRAQPVDRDVRIVIASCSSYIGSISLKETFDESNWTPGMAYARSKLALLCFGRAFQKHLDSYKRPDGLPMRARVIFADPGFCRTPGTLRWITRGSLFGLALYLGAYFVPWFLLKSANQGAQSFLYASMEEGLCRGEGAKLIKECQEVDFARSEVRDEEVAKKLWEESDALIEKVEKAAAKKRASEKVKETKSAEAKEDQERAEEIESLMSAIRKGKAKEAEKQKANKNNTSNETGKADGSGKASKRKSKK
ncbi:unnamed protein product [Clonostachys chloroleuca]|uniref:Uncharacterized protein n=1 Tax=Clonostachys chloroleuca TaxID=1926264 RepID=A0AA35LWB8_9HYPO|nr:unnamed protein product [Clonostachys chloroleuca]